MNQLSMFDTKADAEPEQFTYYERRGYYFDQKTLYKGVSLERRIVEACLKYYDKTGTAANLAEISERETEQVWGGLYVMSELVTVKRCSNISPNNIFVSRV